MTHDEKLTQDIARGAAAEGELRLTKAAFEGLQKDLYERWLSTKPEDDAGRKSLWIATTLLSHVENALHQHVRNGNVAAKAIEAMRAVAEPKRRFNLL